jgi:hypothetical protein
MNNARQMNFRHVRTPRSATLAISSDGTYTKPVLTVRVDGVRYPEISVSFLSVTEAYKWLADRGYETARNAI